MDHLIRLIGVLIIIPCCINGQTPPTAINGKTAPTAINGKTAPPALSTGCKRHELSYFPYQKGCVGVCGDAITFVFKTFCGGRRKRSRTGTVLTFSPSHKYNKHKDKVLHVQ